MKNTQDKKSAKIALNELKQSLKVAVKDKKRWLVCIIEILIAGVLLAVDLLTKQFVYGACKANGKIDIIKGVFSFEAVENTGASFGIFAGKTEALTVVSLLCTVLLLIFIFYSYPRRNLWLRSALILILAGAVGNIVDRIALGYVRDFIYFELINFAVFNFADSCLTVGTAVLIIYVIFFYSKEEKELQDKKKAEAARLHDATVAQNSVPTERAAETANPSEQADGKVNTSENESEENSETTENTAEETDKNNDTSDMEGK